MRRHGKAEDLFDGDLPMPEEGSQEGRGGSSVCAFCWQWLDRDDPDNYREVTSWVTGPKLQSPKLREQTGRMAHKDCTEHLVAGQSPDQEQVL